MHFDKLVFYMFLVQFSVYGVSSNFVEFFQRLPSTFWDGMVSTWETLTQNSVGAIPPSKQPEPRVIDGRLYGVLPLKKRLHRKNVTTERIEKKKLAVLPLMKEGKKETRRTGVPVPLEIPYLPRQLRNFAFKLRRSDNYERDDIMGDGNPYYEPGNSIRHIVSETQDTTKSAMDPPVPPLLFVVRQSRIRGPLYTDDSNTLIDYNKPKDHRIQY